MNESELNYAKNLGKQVAKGGKLFCPLCKEKLTTEFSKDDQSLSSFGDFEDTLFCPHCDTTISIIVDLNRNNGGWAIHVLCGKEHKND